MHCFVFFFNSMAVKKPLLPKKTVPPVGLHRYSPAVAEVSTKNQSEVYSDQVEVCKYLNPFPFPLSFPSR